MSIFLIHRIPIIQEELYVAIREVFHSIHIYRLNNMLELDTISMNIGDLLFIHIETPEPKTLKVLKQLKGKGVKIIVLMESNDETDIKYLLQQKFTGYFSSSFHLSEIIEALKLFQNNKPYLHPALSSLLLEEYISESSNYVKPPHFSLTKREWEVLQLIAEGSSNENVAKHLFLTESTVKNHVSSILNKLDVPDRTSAVIKAYKNKWIHY
ncbi:response regulator transcription factor [Fictibacillus barbaricus]|uniref:Response regulator transcription factor n=1 Tax=Fictibacillus barbaricus TaxID=182136 RepID=A0ABS2ZJ86_9BACL|nr:response regulator transcription factor [Fictibacillus barbaricus]MBN3546716.1 response regulator transcription factor [Fictibacillus barbaricus]GGB43294.1 hypothetical protein GCM10007199_05750 [Fictibacillus barbaricus]